MKRKITVLDSDTKSDLPKWYWARGLHDAHILEKQYINGIGLDNFARHSNCIKFVIDAKQAMFETNIRELRFYNCKELSPELDIINTRWISDTMTYLDGKYVLSIKLRSAKEVLHYSIRFTSCEVIRN